MMRNKGGSFNRGGHDFSKVPSVDIQRSTFSRTHGHKTTMNSGFLVPVYVDEVLPGDTFKLDSKFFARLATPIAPLMDNLHLDVQYFFVPNRLLWQHWEQFCGAQDNPDDFTDYLLPQVVFPNDRHADVMSVYDYMGLPTGIDGIRFNALPLRAYNLIWNDWFRDQNLQDSVEVPRDDGPDDIEWYNLKRRGKRHDYFTSALPWPQKGAAVNLPLGATAPVLGNGKALGFTDGTNSGTLANVTNDLWSRGNVLGVSVGAAATANWAASDKAMGVVQATNGSSGLIADLSQATAATINSLREAFQLQRFFERDARGGTRYTEVLRAHFGVVSPDYRLQRPEYLGGFSAPVVINPVPQMSSTDTTSPQGNLAAFGVVGNASRGFVKSFTEHGWIIGLASVRSDLTYQQGMNRMWSRRTRYDFYWPAFSHLGEQAILNKEIYCKNNIDDDKIFGYQERYAEYRYFPSMITGKFRSTDPQSLDVWHLAQEFGSLPTLSSDFIEERPPVSRVVAVPSEPEFLVDMLFEVSATRPLPVFGVPGMIDHF